MEAVENYIKPGLATAILKPNYELIPVLSFNVSDATAGRLDWAGWAGRLLFAAFDNYLNKHTREKLASYDPCIFMYQFNHRSKNRILHSSLDDQLLTGWKLPAETGEEIGIVLVMGGYRSFI